MTRTVTVGGARYSVWRWIAWGGAAALWLLPLVAMQLTGELRWTGFDFLVWGGLLALAGGAIEWAVRSSPAWTFRAGVALAVLPAFLSLWINGAVGIIGDEDNPANLMFMAVLVIAMVGATLARFEPAGLGRTMVVTGMAQLMVAVIGLVAELGSYRPLIVLTLVFTAMWFSAAELFRKSARG